MVRIIYIMSLLFISLSAAGQSNSKWIKIEANDSYLDSLAHKFIAEKGDKIATTAGWPDVIIVFINFLQTEQVKELFARNTKCKNNKYYEELGRLYEKRILESIK